MKKYVFAKRMGRLGTESAFEVLARAKALESKGKEIIHLEIGEPDFDTPKNIIEKCNWALNNGFTHYTPSAGTMEIRKVIAEYISKTRNIEALPEEVCVGPGGKPILYNAITACVEEGDEVLYPNPTYPTYESVINFVGAKAVPVPLLEEKDFRFEVEALERYITPRTKMIVLNSPENPTGGILTREDLEKIRELAIKHDLLVLSDEIYSRVIYDGKHESIISLPGMKERTILMDGFSKTYAMTGWRLGYGVAPKEIADKMVALSLNTVSCTATFVQAAGIEALQGPQVEVENMVKEFKERRDLVVDGLNSISGVSCRKPKGAFYVFPNVKSFNVDCKKIAEFLLEEAGVACLWGTAFGEYGKGYLRISYANSKENLKKALERINRALNKLKEKLAV